MKSNPKQHQKYFSTSILQSNLQISQHPTIVYHHLNQASLNTEFQSEAPHYGKTFHMQGKMQESVTVFKNSMRKKGSGSSK